VRIALLLALVLVACAQHEAPPVVIAPVATMTTQPAPPPIAPPPPVTPPPVGFSADWDGRPGATGWATATHEALTGPGAALLAANPSDAALFCANFASLSAVDREQFWITLISAVAKRESGFNPTTRYDEPGLDEDSIGLMQLSLGDARIYGCSFTSEADISDPAKNLECAVRIMTRLIPRAGMIGGAGNIIGAAAYWSTLRDRPQNIASRNYVISKTSASRGCAH